jgi:hypothetical protein
LREPASGCGTQSAKDSDSPHRPELLICPRRTERHGDEIMTEKTCAACDCQLDANPIRVKVGGKTVEVCCEECALALNEAGASAAGTSED